MRLGARLLETISKAEQMLERFQVPPEVVGPVVQERRYRDSEQFGHSKVDNFLQSNDFKLKYESALDGSSYRAGEAKKAEQSFNQLYHGDSFEGFKRAPVTFKASDLQRAAIRG